MKVKTRTYQKCPQCGGGFEDTGKALVCKKCLTIPSRFMIRWTYEGEPYRLLNDKETGEMFTSYEQAISAAVLIENEIKNSTFRHENYEGGKSKVNRKFQFIVLYDEWLEEQQDRMSNNEIAPSYYEKLFQYRKKFDAYFGISDIRKIETRDIKKFKMWQSKQVTESGKNKGKKLSLVTQKKVLDTLKNFLGTMKKDKVIKELPDFPSFEIQEKEGRWIEKTIQMRGLAYVEETYRPAIAFIFESGLRTAEVRAIWWDCVKWKDSQPHIVIKRGFSDNTFRDIVKEKNIGYVHITPKIEKILKETPRYLHCNFVFNNNGKPFTRNVLRKAWKRACEKAGIEYITLHEAGRHSFITQKIREGKDPEKVGKAVMHKSIKSQKRYTHYAILDATREVYE